MADLNVQQEKEIGAMQSDIRHMSLAVERIENTIAERFEQLHAMMVEHSKTHEAMAKNNEQRLLSIEFWIRAVKWGAGALTATIMFFTPNLARLLNDRPTEQQVVAIIKEELQAVEIVEDSSK